MIWTICFQGNPEFAVAVQSGLIDIHSISIDAHFYYDEKLLPIRRYLYQADSGTITENAEATLVSGETQVTIGFHALPTDRRSASQCTQPAVPRRVEWTSHSI